MASAESKHGMCMGDKGAIDKYRQGIQLQGEKQKTCLDAGDREGGRKEKEGCKGANCWEQLTGNTQRSLFSSAGHFPDSLFAEPFSHSPPVLGLIISSPQFHLFLAPLTF